MNGARVGPTHLLLSLVSHACYGNGTECNHLLFFNGAVKAIAKPMPATAAEGV